MKVLRDESGQALVVFAVFLGLVMLGFLAFSIDVGMLFHQKRMAQAAADGAALAAAEEISTSFTSEQTAANAVAKMNGFDPTLATNPAQVNLSTPLTGNFIGASFVQATVSRPIPTIFLGVFKHSMATVPVSATSIAGGSQTSQTCVCLEGTTGEVLNLSNAAQLNASGCGIVDNSTSSNALGVVGGATLNGATLGTVSTTWDNSGNINNGGSISAGTKIIQGITSSCSPTMPTAPTYSTCVADPGGSYGTFIWGPASASGVACYKGLTIGANGSTVTLNPGTYVITQGTLHFLSGSGNHSNLGGNGVFFYLTGSASLVIDNGANVNLVAGGATLNGGGTAPSLGAYDGIVIYQDGTDTNALSVQGGSSAYINGAIYAPSAAVTLGNGSGSTVKGGLVANSLTMNGGASLTAITDTNEGSLSVGSPKLVQ